MLRAPTAKFLSACLYPKLGHTQEDGGKEGLCRVKEGKRIQPAQEGGPQVTCQITEFGRLDRKSRWDGHLGGNWAWLDPVNKRRARRLSERTRPIKGTQKLCSLYRGLTLARTINRTFLQGKSPPTSWISVGKEVVTLPPSGHSWNYTVLTMSERLETASNGD